MTHHRVQHPDYFLSHYGLCGCSACVHFPYRPSSSVLTSNKMPVCLETSSEGLWELKEVGMFLRLVSQYHEEKGDVGT